MNSVAELPDTHLNEYPDVSRLLIDLAGSSRHVLFYGPMGSGKTTFIKDLCVVLGSNDNLSSPSYSIVNEYLCNGNKIYHFDLYRVKDVQELMDIGIEDYLASGSWCLFEWPQLVENLVDSNFVRVDLEPNGAGRYVRITKM